MKALKRTLLGIYYFVIALLLLFSIATLSVKRANDIPNLFGRGFLAVDPQANSMVGNNKDSFNPGSLVFVKVLNDKQREALDLNELLEEETVISFYDYNLKRINTHRVIEVTNEGLIRTKGDNAPADEFYLGRDEILAVYSGKVNGLGNLIHFMQTPLGFGIVVVLPTLILLILQGYILIKNIYVVKENKLKEDIATSNELERERIRQELLEELKKEQESEK